MEERSVAGGESLGKIQFEGYCPEGGLMGVTKEGPGMRARRKLGPM